VVYPNSGENWNSQAKSWTHSENILGFGTQVIQWKKEGARIIGGCCRTTPEDIAKIATILEKD